MIDTDPPRQTSALTEPERAELAAWRLSQIVHDTYERSKLAGFLYLFGWVVVGWLGEAHRLAPVPALAMVGVFLALGLLRLAMRPPAREDAAANRRWLRRYAWVLPLAPLAWASLQAWMLVDPRFDPQVRMASLVATIGYATVFVNVYTTVRHFAAVGAISLFLPPLVLLWLDPGQRALAVAMSFYAFYLVGALLRTHREYRRRLDLDVALREQRDRFEALARTDPLTGLANRRQFTDRLETLAARAADGGPAFSLLVLDLDHFKQVNDRLGHLAGDACLVGLAERLRAVFADGTTLLARLGGEEFGVLLPTSAEAAAQAAERLRRELAARPLASEGKPVTITVSVGIGEFAPHRHGGGEGLYRAVDRALYAAKAGGRDRVVIER